MESLPALPRFLYRLGSFLLELEFFHPESLAYCVLLVAHHALVPEVHLPRGLFPAFRVFLRERAVALELPQEAALALRVLPSRLSFRLFCRVLGVFPAERAVFPLFFREFHLS